MKHVNPLSMMLVALLLASCSGNPTANNAGNMLNADLEKAGSPYRWQVTDTGGGSAVMQKKLIGTVAPSSADATLTADVVRAIGQVEAASGGSATPKVIETRQVSSSSKQIREIWVVAREGKSIAYVVTLIPSPQGGTDIAVSGPWQ
jgi:hypothetical protein